MPGAGAVYVFARTGGTWKQQAYMKSSNTGAADIGYQCGYAVALSSDGSTLAVSETSDPSNATGINGDEQNKSAPDSGAVFTFTLAGDSWVQQAYIKPWNSISRADAGFTQRSGGEIALGFGGASVSCRNSCAVSESRTHQPKQLGRRTSASRRSRLPALGRRNARSLRVLLSARITKGEGWPSEQDEPCCHQRYSFTHLPLLLSVSNSNP